MEHGPIRFPFPLWRCDILQTNHRTRRNSPMKNRSDRPVLHADSLANRQRLRVQGTGMALVGATPLGLPLLQ